MTASRAESVALALEVPGRGASVARVFLPDPRPPIAALLLAHGAGAGSTHPQLVALRDELVARSFAVVTFDFLYMHAGRKLPDRLPVLVDTMAAARAALSSVEALVDAPLILAGRSMGGRVATHLAVERPGRERAVVAFAYPLRPPRAKRPADRTSHLASVPVPLVIVQGSRDEFGGASDVRAALRGVAGARVIAVEGADHAFERPKRLASTPVHGELAEAVRAALSDGGVVG